MWEKNKHTHTRALVDCINLNLYIFVFQLLSLCCCVLFLCVFACNCSHTSTHPQQHGPHNHLACACVHPACWGGFVCLSACARAPVWYVHTHTHMHIYTYCTRSMRTNLIYMPARLEERARASLASVNCQIEKGAQHSRRHDNIMPQSRNNVTTRLCAMCVCHVRAHKTNTGIH